MYEKYITLAACYMGQSMVWVIIYSIWVTTGAVTHAVDRGQEMYVSVS